MWVLGVILITKALALMTLMPSVASAQDRTLRLLEPSFSALPDGTRGPPLTDLESCVAVIKEGNEVMASPVFPASSLQGGGEHTITIQNAEGKTFTVQATCFDISGLESEVSNIVSVTFPNLASEPPILQLIGPENNP